MTRPLKLDKRGKLVESEQSVQRRIVDFLTAHGFFVFENRSHGLGGKIAAFATKEQAGSPDLFVWGKSKETWWRLLDTGKMEPYSPAIFFAVEVKRKGGKLSDAQIEWAARFCALGHLLIVAEDTDILERTLAEKGWL